MHTQHILAVLEIPYDEGSDSMQNQNKNQELNGNKTASANFTRLFTLVKFLQSNAFAMLIFILHAKNSMENIYNRARNACAIRCTN